MVVVARVADPTLLRMVTVQDSGAADKVADAHDEDAFAETDWVFVYEPMVIVADPPEPCMENEADAWNETPDRVQENPLIVGAATTAATVVAGAARVVRGGAGAWAVLVIATAGFVAGGAAASVTGADVAVAAVGGSGVHVAVVVAVEVTVATTVGPGTGG